jgi:hypothetical protein
MKKGLVSALIIAVVVVVVAFGGTKLFLKFKTGRKAGLKINSVPQSSVFIDNDLKGNTPFDEKFPSGTYLVKLTPNGTDTNTSSWEKEVTLSSGFLTYINRELGASDLESAGEILSLEKVNSSTSQVSVISTPDGANVALDGQEKGTSPLVIKDVAPGEHTLFVFAPGFKGRQIKIKTIQGHKLDIDVQLSLVPGEGGEATDSAKTKDTKEEARVKILDTPTGWLRVRESPSLSASEAAKVNPDEKFPLLDRQEGWFKIEYKQGKEGWVSSRYAEEIKPSRQAE